jgi:hypothetical protein
MTTPDIGVSIAAAVILLGLFFFWRLSWYGSDVAHSGLWQKVQNDLRLVFRLRTPSRDANDLDTFGSFFLGGKRVGGELTGQTNWSLCFAFANAIWYFAYLGFTYGAWAFALQLPWTAAIFFLARYSRQYIEASNKGTVHGFIRSCYGGPTAVIAAIATCIGYVLNCGFEIFYSVHLLSVAFDFKNVEMIVALGLGFFVTACIVAGGYSANVRTDFWKNLFGVIGLVLLLIALFPTYSSKFVDTTAALIAPWTNPNLNSMPSWHFVLGVSIFAFFFNFVDMANWQSLAANQDLTDQEREQVKRDLRLSAYKQLFAPAFLGACLGVMLKVIQADTPDEQYFRLAFSSAFPTLTLFGGALFGIIVLGLISATISSVDNYLLAAMQTLAVDVFKRSKAATVFDQSLPSEARRLAEREILYWCKRYMPLLIAFMVLSFGGLYYLDKQNVFKYQFVMYGAAVTLFPVVVGAFRHSSQFKAPREAALKPVQPPIPGVWALASIVAGLLAVFGPFFLRANVHRWFDHSLSIGITEDSIADLTPLTGLLAASFVYWIGTIVRSRKKK